jgi:hypothetical protein
MVTANAKIVRIKKVARTKVVITKAILTKVNVPPIQPISKLISEQRGI